MAKYTPRTNEELKELVQDESIYLGDIDISSVKVISTIFKNSTRRDFSGIELWDTSNVVVMNGVFVGASFFNHDISSWDTSNVIDMAGMFMGAKSFNQPLNSWNTSNVVNMYGMFLRAEKFNQPLDNWDTSSVEFMTQMFKFASTFNQNIDSWDISSVRDNQEMFWDSGVSKLPKWYKKRNVANDYNGAFKEAKELVLDLLKNPRPKKPKKPKITPQDKPQSNRVNDLISTWFGFDSSKPPSKGKAILSVIVLIAIFAIFRIVDKSEDSQNNNKATTQATQTTQPKQTQPAQQPTQNALRCNDRDLLKHIIESYKNDLWINRHNSYPDELAYWQELYQKHGINLTNAEELANSLKYNIVNVQTKSSDEVNRQVDCEVEIEVVFPMPQSNPFKIYNAIDYNARIADDNGIEFGILNMRSVDK